MANFESIAKIEEKEKKEVVERRIGTEADFDSIFDKIETEMADQDREGAYAEGDERDFDESLSRIKETFDAGFISKYAGENIESLFDGIKFNENEFRKWYSGLVKAYTDYDSTPEDVNEIIDEYIEKGIIKKS